MINGSDPAFLQGTGSSKTTGLTKREWLIGVAAHGLLANSAAYKLYNTDSLNPNRGKIIPYVDWVSVTAVQQADSLINLLSKEKQI